MIAVSIAALVVLSGAQAQVAMASVPHFANCTAMHKTYKHGVGKSGAHDHVSGKSKPVTNFKVSTSIYNANKKMDGDHDGVACEAH
jgi:Excalibur calcium-binding domain